jgi:hypothetical protein
MRAAAVERGAAEGRGRRDVNLEDGWFGERVLEGAPSKIAVRRATVEQ